jgi:hypothetical protein
MWMLDPRTLCRQHLIGEHSELHKYRHVFVRRYSIAGRLGQIEPAAMKRRHDELATEMLRRGYRHESPYSMPSLSHLSPEDRYGRVDLRESRKLLHERCAECAKRWRLK